MDNKVYLISSQAVHFLFTVWEKWWCQNVSCECHIQYRLESPAYMVLLPAPVSTDRRMMSKEVCNTNALEHFKLFLKWSQFLILIPIKDGTGPALINIFSRFNTSFWLCGATRGNPPKKHFSISHGNRPKIWLTKSYQSNKTPRRSLSKHKAENMPNFTISLKMAEFPLGLGNGSKRLFCRSWHNTYGYRISYFLKKTDPENHVK